MISYAEREEYHRLRTEYEKASDDFVLDADKDYERKATTLSKAEFEYNLFCRNITRRIVEEIEQ